MGPGCCISYAKLCSRLLGRAGQGMGGGGVLQMGASHYDWPPRVMHVFWRAQQQLQVSLPRYPTLTLHASWLPHACRWHGVQGDFMHDIPDLIIKNYGTSHKVPKSSIYIVEVDEKKKKKVAYYGGGGGDSDDE